MQLSHSGTVVQFNDIPPGGCCIFRVAETSHLGIKVTKEEKGRTHTWAAALAPGHPDVDGMPGLYAAQLARIHPALHLPKATISPVLKLGSVHAGIVNKRHAGMLVLCDNLLLMAVHWDQSTIAYVDVHTGAFYPQIPDGNVVWFSGWKILHPGPDEHELLASFPSSSAC